MNIIMNPPITAKGGFKKPGIAPCSKITTLRKIASAVIAPNPIRLALTCLLQRFQPSLHLLDREVLLEKMQVQHQEWLTPVHPLSSKGIKVKLKNLMKITC